jgi:uncharacterized protein YjbI with pentapeptide repeats
METMNNDQLLELLKIGDIKGFNEYRKDNPKQKINFEEENFDCLDLEGINLRGAILRDCTFLGTKMAYSNLKGTNLKDVCFDEADLQGASLWGSYLEGATFSRANLYGVKVDSDGMKMLMDCIGIVAQNRAINITDGWIS